MQDSTNMDKMIARQEGMIGHMIFNNPEKHNAVSLEMWDMADDILDRFEKAESVRVLIVSGAGGKAFVSGADISKFEAERTSKDALDHYNERIKGVYNRVEQFVKPTIAMINGYCLGGGLNLAIACDIRFASDKSKFGMPAARLGLGFSFHSVRRLVNAVGVACAKDLMFSARRIDAGEAYRIGVLQNVVAEEQLEAMVADYAAGIAANAPLTIAAMKFIAGETMKDLAERDLDRCEEMVARCFASDDYKEGQSAFKEKRDPAFKGG